MKHIESCEYKGRNIDIYQEDTSQFSLANTVWKAYIDGSCMSDENPMPGPTLDLLLDDVKKWIDEHPT